MQRYKSGALSDAKIFTLKDGLSWQIGEKTRTEMTLKDWLGKRAQAGRIVPKGFAQSRRFRNED